MVIQYVHEYLESPIEINDDASVGTASITE
jgi:hypothetical protein